MLIFILYVNDLLTLYEDFYAENGKFLPKLSQNVQLFYIFSGTKIYFENFEKLLGSGSLVNFLLLWYLNCRPSILVSDIIWQYQESQPPTMSHQLLRRNEASPGDLFSSQLFVPLFVNRVDYRFPFVALESIHQIVPLM